MNRNVSVAVIGDYNPQNKSHRATTDALRHAARVVGVSLELEWIHTSRVKPDRPADAIGHEGVFLAPGSPYASMEGALAAVRFAREGGRPCAAT